MASARLCGERALGRKEETSAQNEAPALALFASAVRERTEEASARALTWKRFEAAAAAEAAAEEAAARGERAGAGERANLVEGRARMEAEYEEEKPKS
jgi:hypothetical protein